MQAWRIAKRQHALDRQGTGARLAGGRWNSPDVAAIYAGLTPEIAALEKLVHTGEILPADLVLVVLELPDDPKLYQRYMLKDLPPGWDDLPSSALATQLGDRFLFDGVYLGLIIPSAVMPESNNILLNPNHAVFSGVTMVISRSFEFDSRLR
jgi:RES domain-containing protein